MLILLSCAKTMSSTSTVAVPLETEPYFRNEAKEIALQMSQFPVEELESILGINSKLAVENYKRFQYFHSVDNKALQAILAYTGIVFKRLNVKDFTRNDFLYAQDHLRLTSFCYGLLRPLDGIKLYRMEGNIALPEFGGINMFDYWQPKLTDLFIETIKQQGGVLVNLASEEMKQLFDWKRVENAIRIVTPEFKIWKDGKLSTIVIYTKMSRGEMTRHILKNRIENPEELKLFSWEGFAFDDKLSDEKKYVFTLY